MIEFEKLIKKKIIRLFFVLWAPWGEENHADMDIAFGFVFKDEPDRLCVVRVDKDELWSPHVFYESLPLCNYTWEDFYSRLKMWMESEDDYLVVDKEYYEVTEWEIFKTIVNTEIEEIELLILEGTTEPFGVRISFENDYIISIPNSDGNTVETKLFNKNNSIENFKHLGNIIYSKVKFNTDG